MRSKPPRQRVYKKGVVILQQDPEVLDRSVERSVTNQDDLKPILYWFSGKATLVVGTLQMTGAFSEQNFQ